jgi:glyoxylase-like metal-dependent hydrolase (beta-lactamase superfamily II)
METKAFDLLSTTVGALQANCYVLTLPGNRCLLFDPGAEPDKVQALIDGHDVVAILLTHGHGDHIGAVNDVKRTTDAPAYLHPADASLAKSVTADHDLRDGDTLQLNDVTIRVVHTPGHTPGQVSFLLPDNRVVVGDTIFEGGPGRTWSADDFRTTLQTLRTILEWPDDAVCYPGHGTAFRLGDIRAAVQAFVEHDHPAGFYGDAEWEIERFKD